MSKEERVWDEGLQSFADKDDTFPSIHLPDEAQPELTEAEARQVAIMIGVNMVKFERTYSFEMYRAAKNKVFYIARWTAGIAKAEIVKNGRKTGQYTPMPVKKLMMFTVGDVMEKDLGRPELERQLVEKMIIDGTLDPIQ